MKKKDLNSILLFKIIQICIIQNDILEPRFQFPKWISLWTIIQNSFHWESPVLLKMAEKFHYYKFKIVHKSI
jgi:hypothetical protein